MTRYHVMILFAVGTREELLLKIITYQEASVRARLPAKSS